MKSFNIHFCPLGKDCRPYHAPIRLYLTLFGWTIVVGAKTQGWRPSKGYTGNWHYIVVYPNKKWICGKILNTKPPNRAICPRFKHHRGECYNWTKDKERIGSN